MRGMSALAPSVERGAQSPKALPSFPVSRGPLLPGAYAWLSTVLLPVQSLNGGLLVQSLAWASGVALLIGQLPVLSRFRLLHGLSLGVFVAGCVATWIALADQMRVAPLDPIQAAAGGIGWVLFALSMPSQPLVPEAEASRLVPTSGNRQRRFSPALNVAFLVVVVAGLLPLLLAWRVERTAHAALAQVVACASVLAGLSLAGSLVDAAALRRRLAQPRMRLADSWSTFALLALLLVVGLVLKLF